MTHTTLAQKLKTLPGLTDTECADLLALLAEQPTYGLVWENKPEQVEEDLRNKLPVLLEVTDRRITAKSTPAESSPAGTGGSNPSLSAPLASLPLT